MRVRALFSAIGAGVVACVAVLAPATAHASPEDLFGYGSRTSAMGSTGVTHAQGYETAWHNPALASTIRKNKLTLGYVGGVLRLDAKGEGLPGRVSEEPIKGTIIGADLPIPLGGVLKDRFGVAFAFYQPTDLVVRGRVLYPEKTQFPILSDRAQSITLRAGLGADIAYGFRLGLGVAALAEIAGNVVAATDASGRVGTRVETQLVATYAPVIGATWDVPGKSLLRLGLTYRGELDARFAVTIDASKISSLKIPLFNISGIAQYDPAQIAAEVGRIDTKGLNVLAAQFVFKKWSSFPGVLEPTVVCSEGGPGACGLSPPTIPWRDTIALRLGADQGFTIARGAVLHARGGGFYETSPLPAELPTSEAFDTASAGVVSVPTRYFDSDRLALTLGTGLDLADPLPPISLDLYGQYHVLVPRTITSSDGAGTTLSEGESSGNIAVFGMTAGVKF